MTIAQLNSFIILCETLNFTEAAKRLYITQSYLSRQIAAMEQEIGFPLFARTKRQVVLTPQGESMLAELGHIPKLVDTAINKSASMSNVVRGTVSMGILDGVPVYHDVPGRMKQLNMSYPEIIIQQERFGFRELREGLSTGRLDLIITLAFDVIGEEFEYYVLTPQQQVIAINRNHPLSQKEDLSLFDLREERFAIVSPQESENGYQSMISRCNANGFNRQNIILFKSMESIFLNVEVGQCAAIINSYTRLSNHPGIRLVPLAPLDEPRCCVDIVLAWKKGNHNPALPVSIKAFS